MKIITYSRLALLPSSNKTHKMRTGGWTLQISQMQPIPDFIYLIVQWMKLKCLDNYYDDDDGDDDNNNNNNNNFGVYLSVIALISVKLNSNFIRIFKNSLII
jgi:hypothetical protein